MCKTSETKDNDDTYKTSYQRAHYYENVIDLKPKKDSQAKSTVRPDLYVYDPIINKKSSTYNKYYGEKKSYEKPTEFYGQFCFTSRSSYKNIYNDFLSKPVGILKNDVTTSGTHYDDPRIKAEVKLLHEFNEETSQDAIKPPDHKDYDEFNYPYVSTYKSHYENCTESFLNGIAKDDVITYYNGRVKNKIPPKKQRYPVEPKFFFKVPFHGDTSLYQESYVDPAKKDAFVTKVCLSGNYFESIKTEIENIPKMYSTEQTQIGSGVKDIV